MNVLCRSLFPPKQKNPYFVILSEARNLSVIAFKKKRDSSANTMPQNDKCFRFS
jgi:hypothetical protein